MKNVGNTYALRHFSKIKKTFIILHSKKIIAGKGSGKDVEFEEEKKELSSKVFFPRLKYRSLLGTQLFT